MRISLNWLQEMVELELAPQELAETLTMAGFEVEDIEDRRTWAEGVVVGKVLQREPHPNADRLSVTQVDIGKGAPLNIVCGAANVRTGIYVPVATVGTYLPKIDLKIRASKIRGVPSEGMICSLAELGLAKESAGIHIFASEPHGSCVTVGNPPNTSTPLSGTALPHDTDFKLGNPPQLGVDARPLLGLDDVILDLTATANRADALSMVGVAREVAALTGATLTLPAPSELSIPDGSCFKLGDQPNTSTPLSGTALPHINSITLKISESQACPAYIGTVISSVKITQSPSWLQQRLQAAGVRPINNVVDITNYILLEWGQPLHAFDYDRLVSQAGGEAMSQRDGYATAIGVRFAQSGESLKTLDSQTRSLSAQTLLITANNQPVALAGVMGGEETEVHDNTQNLFLEAALFDPVAIRRSARSLGLRTEASARYERGVNQAELDIACRRALTLLNQLAEATPVTQQIADTRSATTTRSIELRLERVNQVLGPIDLGETTDSLQSSDVEPILTALGCQMVATQPQVWKVTVPPYRYRDLEREIDLIEEIARLYGYDRFCDTLPDKTEPGYLSVEQQLTRQLRAAFRAAGLTELIHYSLVKPGQERQVMLANPLFAEYSALRTDLLSGLIDAFEYNQSQGNGCLNGFEIGRIFWQEEGLQEKDAIAGILGGDPTQGKWSRGGREQPLTWFEGKGVLASVFQRLGLTVEYQPDRRDPRLHPGRTASLWLQGNRLGTFGQLHPQLRLARNLPDAVYVFEIDLDILLDGLAEDENLMPRFQPYSTYPASDRDIAFFAPIETTVAEFERAIALAGGDLLESVELFDEYRGEHVPEGQRSLAFRLVYRASDRTLTDEAVAPVHQKVREFLVEKFRVNLRS